MVVASKIVLPIEPAYVGHRDAEERRKSVAEWLRQREQEVDKHASRPLARPGSAQPGQLTQRNAWRRGSFSA
jgi:hypothetical protein